MQSECPLHSPHGGQYRRRVRVDVAVWFSTNPDQGLVTGQVERAAVGASYGPLHGQKGAGGSIPAYAI